MAFGSFLLVYIFFVIEKYQIMDSNPFDFSFFYISLRDDLLVVNILDREGIIDYLF